MNKNLPTLSIITTCFNAQNGILKTLDSIRELKRSTNEVEYIIQDGQSTDRTLDIINQHLDIVDKLESEPDQGIYDGMNKAVKHVKGKYIIFINADDTLITSGILDVLNEFKKKKDLDFLACDVIILNTSSEEVGKRLARLEPLSFKHSGMPCSHQGFICKTQKFNELGGFDIKFKVAGDYEFILRCLNTSKNFKNKMSSIAKYPLGGVSYGNSARWENFRIQKLYIGKMNALKNLTRESISSLLQKVLPSSIIKQIKKIRKSQYSYISKK